MFDLDREMDDFETQAQCEEFWPDDDRDFDPRDEDCGCDCGDAHCPRCSDWDEDDDEGFQMSDAEADADTLAGAGLGDPDDERDYIDDCNDFDDF